MAENVIYIKGTTAEISGTAIVDGQLLWDETTGQTYIDVGSVRKPTGKIVDTALSTTSTNAIANNAITTSIVNTTAEVSAITDDYIPCGTKPVKELITNLTVIGNKVDNTNTYTLLATHATTTYTAKTITDLDEFREIQVEMEDSNGTVIATSRISISRFKTLNSTSKEFCAFYGSGKSSVYYSSDTVVYMYAVASYVTKIYGIK